MRSKLFVMLVLSFSGSVHAQHARELLELVKAKIEKVNNYTARGEMKTTVSFMKVPAAEVKVYFKQPGRVKIVNEKGISLVPKGTVSISLSNLLHGDYQALDAGNDVVNGRPVTVINLLPSDQNGEVVLSRLYIDTARALILLAKTTTRQSGTNELEMTYGRYAAFALPDKVIFTFSTQDYKLPKGVTFDYDDGSTRKKESPGRENQRGKIEIDYHDYTINKGLADAVFQ